MGASGAVAAKIEGDAPSRMRVKTGIHARVKRAVQVASVFKTSSPPVARRSLVYVVIGRSCRIDRFISSGLKIIGIPRGGR